MLVFSWLSSPKKWRYDGERAFIVGELSIEPKTAVFIEAPHKIVDAIADIYKGLFS